MSKLFNMCVGLQHQSSETEEPILIKFQAQKGFKRLNHLVYLRRRFSHNYFIICKSYLLHRYCKYTLLCIIFYYYYMYRAIRSCIALQVLLSTSSQRSVGRAPSRGSHCGASLCAPALTHHCPSGCAENMKIFYVQEQLIYRFLNFYNGCQVSDVEILVSAINYALVYALGFSHDKHSLCVLIDTNLHLF